MVFFLFISCLFGYFGVFVVVVFICFFFNPDCFLNHLAQISNSQNKQTKIVEFSNIAKIKVNTGKGRE